MKRLLFLLALAACLDGAAQEHTGPWTLDDCIARALERNISLQQRDLQVRQQEIELDNARGSRLPSVSSSLSENFSFGRGLTADNTYSNTNTTSTGLNVGASVPVFQGFRLKNAVRQGELNLEAATADLGAARDNIRVAVAQAFVQSLYNLELLDVARRQVSIDSLQTERLVQLERSGKASPAEVAQQRAELGQSRLGATRAANNLHLSLLDLAQLLELPSAEGFTIVRPEAAVEGILLPAPESVYADAVAERDVIRAEELRRDASEWTVRMAKGAFLPSLSLSGGVGTNYYTMSAAPSASFFDQMKNNFSQFLGLSLSVPVFTGRQNRNQVRAATLSQHYQTLQLEQTKKTLFKEIQQAWSNAVAAQERYASGLEAAQAAREAFELVKGRYENGKANVAEFAQSRDAMLRAESDVVQARYELLFGARLLDFYSSGEMTF